VIGPALCTAPKNKFAKPVAFFVPLNKVEPACWLTLSQERVKKALCLPLFNNGQQAMHRKAKSRPRTLADMAIVLADTVPELGDDERCRAALRAAGVAPFYAARFEAARDLARTARAAAADLWAIVQCR
jgi:hypothetical protein